MWNWHLDALCQHLEAITFGQLTRLLANVPPGSSKSLIVSVMWQAWEWGPCGMAALRYLATAFNDGPVKRDTRKCRDLILSEWYRSLWPHVVLTRTGETSFANSSTGTREGVAFGSITSQRGDRFIVDDPHSTQTAESEAERTRTVRQFQEGAINRLNDQNRSALVVIMQRLHSLDVSAAILKSGMGFEHLCLPMEFEPERRCTTSIGFTDPRSYDGELLDPVRFPREVIERDFKPYAYAWAGQYQQRPAPREGGIFKRHWFQPMKGLPPIKREARGWDIGATEGAGDYTAGVKCAQGLRGEYIITNVRRGRWSAAGVEAQMAQTAALDGVGCTVTVPQDPGAAGKAYANALVLKLPGYAVKKKLPTGDKATRAAALAAQAEAGNVYILVTGDPALDAWVEPFLAEAEVFPAGAHDDQIDAAADAFNELALAPAPPEAVFAKYGSGGR